jgi:hypothetical protein
MNQELAAELITEYKNRLDALGWSIKIDHGARSDKLTIRNGRQKKEYKSAIRVDEPLDSQVAVLRSAYEDLVKDQ